MENKILIKFLQEKKQLEIDISQPDLSALIHMIVSEHLLVNKENIEIETNNKCFDKEEFRDVIIEVHEEFSEEIEEFFENIKKEIRTYYEDDELSEEVIKRIKESIE